jgi:tRNA(Ile)-lysidine synthase
MAGLGPWPASRRVALAVSGGADSLCLAYLCAAWGAPFALIVDHGLREAAADEAAATASRLDAMAVPRRILRLSGLHPGPALAERARAARYAALTEAARGLGMADLLLGHHRLDQAETLMLRQASGSGPAGLAGMAAIKEINDLRLVRPLLGVPPGALRATLRAAGIGWVNDPSNRDRAATRTRLRQELNDGEGAGQRVAALAAAAARHGGQRAAAEAAAAEALARQVALRPEGFAVLRGASLPEAALAALLRTLAGAPYAASRRQLAGLAARLRPAVLAGVRLLAAGRLGPGLLLVREEAAMAAPVPARHGTVWDGRFRLEAPAGLPEGLEIGALGADAAALRAQSALPSSVLRTLPALRLQGMLAAVPHIGYRSLGLHLDVAVRFGPAHPLAGAPFRVAAGGCQGRQEHPC